MISLSPEAEAQLDGLLTHYERLERIEASRNLLIAVESAMARIPQVPDTSLPAPRPYPLLASLGFRWIKEGSYWIAYSRAGKDEIIAGIYHETADIPNRVLMIG